MANSFEYFSPTRVIFGKETEKQTGKLIREYGGSRVLVLYGGKSAVRSGLLDLVKESLKEEELYFQELGGIIWTRYMRVSRSVKMRVLISCWPLAVEVLLIQPRRSLTDLASRKRMSGNYMSIQEKPESACRLPVY
jgi:hypothetical protein